MFTSLSDRLTATFRSLRGKGRLTEADVDATVLDPMRRRDAGWRPDRDAVAQRATAPPRLLMLPAASGGATVVEVRAMDRPGLLHALGSELAQLGVEIHSAHVATYGGQAVDVLYLGEPGGAPLEPSRVAAAVSVLAGAADVPGATEPPVLRR